MHHDINPGKMQQLAEANVELMIVKAFKRHGMETLRRLYAALRELYSYIEAEFISTQLVFVAPLDLHTPHFGKIYDEIQLLARDIDSQIRTNPITIMLGSNGNTSWKIGIDDLASLSTNSIVYNYKNEQEVVFAKGNYKSLINPSNILVSIFALPSFKVLEKALDRYSRTIVRHSAGFGFSSVWNDPNRIHFCNKPESKMRDSIYDYLYFTFRDAQIRKEAVVDSSHPVDIMLTWISTTRIALIEIKWVGDAITPTGKTTSYRDARGRSGAKQLEDYLDKNAQQTPMHTSRGYLVVVDGRRKGITNTSTFVSYTDGMHYENLAIDYDTPTSTRRVDFATPIRMFAEPICKTV